MNARRGLVLLAVVGLLVAIFYYRPGSKDNPASHSAPSNPHQVSSKVTPGKPALPQGGPASPVEERSTLADLLNAKNRDIRSDLQVLANVLDGFRSNFPQRGNPTGTNAEITAVLTGKNPLQLALIPRDQPAINERGEICDRWGHPFFFHQISGTQMEIRSAGPDQKLWTDDDVVLPP